LRSFIKGLIFKTYPRPAVIFPENLEWEKLDNTTIKIKFTLEKGAYATLVVKRLFYGYQNS
jgi:tRNA pseudouridine synthase D (TruD).